MLNGLLASATQLSVTGDTVHLLRLFGPLFGCLISPTFYIVSSLNVASSHVRDSFDLAV